MVSTAQLQARLDELKLQKEQAIANANACTGAIQVVEALLVESATSDTLERPTTCLPAKD